jgi:hypothetical protein
MAALLINPASRRKAKKTAKRKPIRARARSAVARVAKKVRRYRRNPIAVKTGIMDQLMGAAVGAGGAVAVDVVMSKAPFLKDQTGVMRTVLQGAASIGLGMAVAKFGKNKKLGLQVATGGLTVALHKIAYDQVKKSIPALNLAGDGLLGYEELNGSLLGWDDLDGELEDGAMGWLSPAPVSDGFDYN